MTFKPVFTKRGFNREIDRERDRYKDRDREKAYLVSAFQWNLFLSLINKASAQSPADYDKIQN